MEIIEKIRIIDERISMWETLSATVSNDLQLLNINGEIDGEDNGGKAINLEHRILDGQRYIDMCDMNIEALNNERLSLTNQG